MTQHENIQFTAPGKTPLPTVDITILKKLARKVSIIAAIGMSIPSYAGNEQNSSTAGTNDAAHYEPKKNNAPEASTDFVDLGAASNAFNALANDADSDGDRLFMVEAAAKFGAVAFTPEGLLAYAQNPGPARADEITYMVSDGRGGFDKGVVEIFVR